MDLILRITGVPSHYQGSNLTIDSHHTLVVGGHVGALAIFKRSSHSICLRVKDLAATNLFIKLSAEDKNFGLV